MAGKHRDEDKDKKRPVGETQRKITPEERKKATEPPKEDPPKGGRHRKS